MNRPKFDMAPKPYPELVPRNKEGELYLALVEDTQCLHPNLYQDISRAARTNQGLTAVIEVARPHVRERLQEENIRRLIGYQNRWKKPSPRS